MTNRISERRLVDVLMSSLRTSHHLGREVKHYEKRIDIVAICCISRESWSIEAKIDNWAQAMRQAIVNLAATERSYIAIYDKYAHRVPLELLQEHRIGLITVGTKWGEVEVILRAEISPFVNPLASERLRRGIIKGGLK